MNVLLQVQRGERILNGIKIGKEIEQIIIDDEDLFGFLEYLKKEEYRAGATDFQIHFEEEYFVKTTIKYTY